MNLNTKYYCLKFPVTTYVGLETEINKLADEIVAFAQPKLGKLEEEYRQKVKDYERNRNVNR